MDVNRTSSYAQFFTEKVSFRYTGFWKNSATEKKPLTKNATILEPK